MKNKFLLTVSNLSLFIIIGVQNVQAMEDSNEIKDGYYRIKCQQFSNKNNPEDDKDPEGLLHVIKGNNHWINHFQGDRFWGNVLHDTKDKDNYLEHADQSKEVIWHVQKVQDPNVGNAYTLKNLAHSHFSHMNAGLLSNSQVADCDISTGRIPTIVKEYDTSISTYLATGTRRKEVLWNIISAEEGAYKIRSFPHSQPNSDDWNEGCLAAADNSRSDKGFFAEVLAAYSGSNYCKEFYFVNKENNQPGRSRKRLLWNLLEISYEETKELLPQQLSTVDIKIQANSIQSVQVNK